MCENRSNRSTSGEPCSARGPTARSSVSFVFRNVTRPCVCVHVRRWPEKFVGLKQSRIPCVRGPWPLLTRGSHHLRGVVSLPYLVGGYLHTLFPLHHRQSRVTFAVSFLSVDPSPWSAVRGSPELRAYSSMPRGSAPWWPHRGTAGSRPSAGRAQPPAAYCVRATAETTTTTTTDDDGDQATVAADVTVHLVDTCGRVIDIRTSEPTATTKTATTTADGALPSSPDGGERDRPKRSVVPTECCPSQAQDDNHLKHIPPGKSGSPLILCLFPGTSPHVLPT